MINHMLPAKIRAKEQGITHQKIADQVGKPRAYITHVLNGDTKPNVEIALKIFEIVGIKISDQ